MTRGLYLNPYARMVYFRDYTCWRLGGPLGPVVADDQVLVPRSGLVRMVTYAD